MAPATEQDMEQRATGQFVETVRISFPVDQVWRLISEERAQTRWLGVGSRLGTRNGEATSLCRNGQPWASGWCTVAEDGKRVVTTARCDGATFTATLLVTCTQGACTVEASLRCSSATGQQVRTEVQVYWADALARLKRLASAVGARRKTPRQAIVVIHGIGNQEPGRTIRSFVEAVFGPATADAPQYSKPDRLSETFEMRRINVRARQNVPTTDVFELYWAHLIVDTTLSQVVAWARQLVLRRRLPKQFIALRAVLGVVGALLVAGTLAHFVPEPPSWLPALLRSRLPAHVPPWVPGLGAVATATAFVFGWLWRLVGRGFATSSAGDAARYLAPRPANIGRRQEIRTAGVDLLKRLHESGNYDRIVLVGHSVGSVIAYDILRFLWIELGPMSAPAAAKSAISEMEKAMSRETVINGPARQCDVWYELRRNGQPWLVSDLVTVGSPLSMADFLMARTPAEFGDSKLQRELPTCPPVTETVKVGNQTHQRISYDDGSPKRALLHHAALFSATRWTNLHFPVKLVHGDPIGGPVAKHFGKWVSDIALARPEHGRFLHGAYWQSEKGGDAALRELRTALGLECARSLRAVIEGSDPTLYLPPI